MMRSVDAQSGDSINAINLARAATAEKYRYQESSPLVKTALSDARTSDPLRIANSFIMNGTPRDALSVAKEVGPAGLPVIRDAIATAIKKEALSGASDEIGKVSQSRLNSAINKAGIEKLRLFFSPEEVEQLRTTGRVASYMQTQPTGSAVNNSNSGALILGNGYDWLKSVASKVPGGQQFIVDPLRNIDISIAQRRAQDIAPAIIRPQPRQPMGNGLLGPLGAIGGVLAGPQGLLLAE
jgi:hypothetical protein